MVVQDIDAMDQSRDRLTELADDAQALKEAAADADPEFGTWGPFLGALVGLAYSGFVSWQVTALMEDVPAAIEAHAIRLDACARAYQATDEDIAAQLAIVNSSLDEVAAAVTQAQIC
ncbi:hypothetical protein K3N28_22035 [Glycomyces sp. TRM65418]|uniref:hypothetical protein n=1 Tax=Glycomyces sp. TRM65418 TaxID=2867006 RepID=UPI001CE6EEEC|nr:hypothetical protein [Glycomyces sp. TRM65418]MCC3765743.1 hypothetical protein [Glycomyces sp. TRM65418]QZD55334.1 hypothetical protein K3N28_21915 [Glycomyces sp. TRM65418]